MPKERLSPDIVTKAAAAFVDRHGPANLTLTALAAELGVAPPSLYKHISGLDDLVGRVSTLATRQLADQLTTIGLGRSKRRALIAVAEVYRRFAVEHHGLYVLTQGALDIDAEVQRLESRRCLIVFEALIESYDIPPANSVDAIRLVRAALHGFTDIEARGGFQMARSIDLSFSVLLEALNAALCNLAKRLRIEKAIPIVKHGKTLGRSTATK